MPLSPHLRHRLRHQRQLFPQRPLLLHLLFLMQAPPLRSFPPLLRLLRRLHLRR